MNPNYRQLLERVIGAKMRQTGFRAFCEAQTLRDALMARNLERLASRSPGSIVVGLTGVFHAWQPAVPAQLAQLGAGRVVVLLPEEGTYGSLANLRGQADYVWRMYE